MVRRGGREDGEEGEREDGEEGREDSEEGGREGSEEGGREDGEEGGRIVRKEGGRMMRREGERKCSREAPHDAGDAGHMALAGHHHRCPPGPARGRVLVAQRARGHHTGRAEVALTSLSRELGLTLQGTCPHTS